MFEKRDAGKTGIKSGKSTEIWALELGAKSWSTSPPPPPPHPIPPLLVSSTREIEAAF